MTRQAEHQEFWRACLVRQLQRLVAVAADLPRFAAWSVQLGLRNCGKSKLRRYWSKARSKGCGKLPRLHKAT